MARMNYDALVAAIDVETTRIAGVLQALKDQLAEGGMSATEEAEVLASLQAQVDRLKGIGVDPAEPIPLVEPPI